jgi:hypothetical protein
MVQIDRAMAACFQSRKCRLPKEKNRDRNMRVGIDHTFFEAGDGHDYFECRSRRKLSLGGAIVSGLSYGEPAHSTRRP